MRKVRNFNAFYLVPRFWLLFDEKVQLVNYQKKSLSPISSCLLIVRMYGTYKSFNLNQQVVRYINLEVYHDITTFLKRASFQTHGKVLSSHISDYWKLCERLIYPLMYDDEDD